MGTLGAEGGLPSELMRSRFGRVAAMVVLSRTVGLTNEDFAVLYQARETTQAVPMRLE